MSDNITANLSAVFPRFNHLPEELRLDIWFLALPGPRIVYVQRRLTSGQDAEEDWYAIHNIDGPYPPAPSYFMSPSSSAPILPLLQTCRESRWVTKKSYILLFPESSTWFSFSTDFLYLDFGASPHVMHYRPRDFSASISEPFYILDDPHLSRCTRPKFNMELAKKVKNLAITIALNRQEDIIEFVSEILQVFTDVKVLVLADILCNLCREQGDELAWLRGQLGDELSSVSQPEYDGQQRHELEKEKEHRLILRKLQLWRAPGNYGAINDEIVPGLLREWERVTTKDMPIVIRKAITTANVKNRLLQICGSEENFKELLDLDWEFVQGLHKYNGSLSLSQQIAFLYLVAERISDDYDRNCRSCFIDGGLELMIEIPVLLAKIDALDSEMQLYKVEKIV